MSPGNTKKRPQSGFSIFCDANEYYTIYSLLSLLQFFNRIPVYRDLITDPVFYENLTFLFQQ